MKKATAILLMLLFLISQSGIALSLHWCGGKVTSIDVFSSHAHRCACKKKEMKPGCCKDKTTYFKVKTILAKEASQIEIKQVFSKLFLRPFSKITIGYVYNPVVRIADFYHPPPLMPKSPIYLLDRVIII